MNELFIQWCISFIRLLFLTNLFCRYRLDCLKVFLLSPTQYFFKVKLLKLWEKGSCWKHEVGICCSFNFLFLSFLSCSSSSFLSWWFERLLFKLAISPQCIIKHVCSTFMTTESLSCFSGISSWDRYKETPGDKVKTTKVINTYLGNGEDTQPIPFIYIYWGRPVD